MILLSHDLGQHFVKSMGENKWPPTHAPTPFSAPSPSSVPHICPSHMPHNFRSSPMTQLPTEYSPYSSISSANTSMALPPT